MEPLKKKLVLAIALVVLAVAGVLLWRTWPPTQTNMALYAPASSLVFVQIDRLPDVANGLADTTAWRTLAPAFGLSTSIEFAGPVGDTLASLGIGGDEARALGRAQVAAVVTGLEATTVVSSEATGEIGPEVPPGAPPDTSPEASSLVLKPRFALLFETHLSEGSVRRAVDTRLPDVARRLFGEDALFDASQYNGIDVAAARPVAGDRALVWSVRDGLVIVANHQDAMRAVLDTTAGGSPSLASDFYLAKVRPEVASERAAVFAFFTEAGVGKLVGVGPGIVAGTITADPAKGATVSRLFGGMSEKAVKALGISAAFEDGLVVDRYFTVLAPPVAAALSKMRPGVMGAPASALVPVGVDGATYVRVQEPGQAFDSLLAGVSSSVDAGTSLVIGQIAIELRRSYGVEPEAPISAALGDEVLFVDFGEGQPLGAVFAVRDQAALLPVAERYMRKEGGRVAVETYRGVEILHAENPDGRAVAFVGDYVVAATRDQIVRMVDAREAGRGGAEAIQRAVERKPSAILVTQRSDASATGDLFVALSKKFGAPEAMPASLDGPRERDTLANLPFATSVSESRGGGLYSETRSAVGNFAYLTVLLGEE